MAGPQKTRANLRDDVRLHVRDTSTTQPGLSDANINSLLDRALLAYAARMDGDEVLSRENSTTLIAGQNAATQLFSGHAPLSIESVFLTGIKKLKKTTLNEILKYQAENPNETGEPDYYAINAALTRDAWAVYVDKIADRNYDLTVWTRVEPILYTGDSDTTTLGDHAAFCIATIAAVHAARILGRPQAFIENLAWSLPEDLRPGLGVAFRGTSRGGASAAREP